MSGAGAKRKLRSPPAALDADAVDAQLKAMWTEGETRPLPDAVVELIDNLDAASRTPAPSEPRRLDGED